MKKLDLSKIPLDPPPPWLQEILDYLDAIHRENAELQGEIDRLKKRNKRPKLSGSSVEKPKRDRDEPRGNGQEPLGRGKRNQESRVILPSDLPIGSRLKGYREYTVQELSIEAKEILFKLAVYTTPDGQTVKGELPSEYSHGHFGPGLVAHILQLYHGGTMTQPALLRYLHEQGIDISTGQLHYIITEQVGEFIDEIDAVAEAGKRHSTHLHADDTGARHGGKNGVCTCLSSPLFCYFRSSFSKSRLNFIEILRGPHSDLLLDESALLYAHDHGVSSSTLERLEELFRGEVEKRFPERRSWDRFLKRQKITSAKEIRLLTEGAMLASAIAHGLPEGIPIVTDAAPQFYLWSSNALCWIHEERHYRKLVPRSEAERLELERIQGDIWTLYERLKRYIPSDTARFELRKMFDEAFCRPSVTDRLTKLLQLTCSRKQGLLQVLSHPEVSLHNNDCERDIREYVKRRKVSGTTRSAQGQRARDAFLSLKKTCLKLGVCFYGYIRDRVYGHGEIPCLDRLIVLRMDSRSQSSAIIAIAAA